MRLLAQSNQTLSLSNNCNRCWKAKSKNHYWKTMLRRRRSFSFCDVGFHDGRRFGGQRQKRSLGPHIWHKNRFARPPQGQSYSNSMNRYLQIVRKPIHDQHDELMQWDQHNRNLKFLAITHIGLKPTWAIHRSYATMNCEKFVHWRLNAFASTTKNGQKHSTSLLLPGFLKSVPPRPIRWQTVAMENHRKWTPHLLHRTRSNRQRRGV